MPADRGNAPAGHELSPAPDRELPAPVAVRLVELDGGADLDLGPAPGGAYRSALVIGTVDGRPVGQAVFALNGSQLIAHEEIVARLATIPDQESRPDAPEHTTPLPSVSVVVNTCADAGAVVRTVRSILACEPAPLEVVVVENRPAGSPVPAALAERFGGDPRIRYVEEAHPGLAAARNAGLRAARGEVIAFTDDDVVVDRRWVGALAMAFASDPLPACVTGLILPGDLDTPEQVRIEQFAGFGKGYERRVHRLDEPTSPLHPFAAGEFGSGANTALRADVARALGGFDPALGTGTVARGGEDLDLFVRILLGGHTLVYEPAAILWHRHPHDRAQLRRRVYGYGVSIAAMVTKHALSGQARAVLRRLPEAYRFLRDPDSRKNVRKPADYPRRLEWLERLGMVAGPALYLASRRRARRAPAATPVHPPTWVGEVDVYAGLRDVPVPAQADGRPYASARLLVRASDAPVGFVDLPVTAGLLPAGRVSAEVDRRLHRALAARRDLPPVRRRPEASVVVCTHERPESLREALRSIVALDYPAFEVIVVDNNPRTDATLSVVERLDDRRVRRVVEPVPGLSRARNRALREAGAEIIAFTDDDVVVDPGWLHALVRGFERAERVACVTGLVPARALDTPAQAFFESKVKWTDQLAPQLFDLGANRRAGRLFPYRAGDFGAGANFAVAASAISSIGTFDEALGAGTLSKGGEDLDFFARVVLCGWTLAFESAAIVWHEHRRDADALRGQMIGYGSGLTAYAFKHLMQPSTWARLLSPSTQLGNTAAETGYPALPSGHGARSERMLTSEPIAGLRAAELRGMLIGPWTYVRGRREVAAR
jgi:GT2 family glycosyltransferase